MCCTWGRWLAWCGGGGLAQGGGVAGRELSLPASHETARGSRRQIHVRTCEAGSLCKALWLREQKGPGRAGALLRPAAPREACAALHERGTGQATWQQGGIGETQVSELSEKSCSNQQQTKTFCFTKNTV